MMFIRIYRYSYLTLSVFCLPILLSLYLYLQVHIYIYTYMCYICIYNCTYIFIDTIKQLHHFPLHWLYSQLSFLCMQKLERWPLTVTGDKPQPPSRKRNPPVFLAKTSMMIFVACLGPFHHDGIITTDKERGYFYSGT